MARVTILGAGYVGLSCGVGLAELGHQVQLVEKDDSRYRQLKTGTTPIYEPQIDVLYRSYYESGVITVDHADDYGLEDVDFVVACLPTPQGNDGSTDMTMFNAAVRALPDKASRELIFVVKSTVPVGTCRALERKFSQRGIKVASNPEFVREGHALHDFMNPARIVVGGSDNATVKAVAELYEAIDAPIIQTDFESAEMIKYASNVFLAIKLSYINSLANYCERIGADVAEVTRGMGLDPRIGSDFLNPGPGWGGSCFPKDVRALLSMSSAVGIEMCTVEGALIDNDLHIRSITERVLKRLDNQVERVVAIWGFAFKAGTDDTRDSSAVEIARSLADSGIRCVVYDPVATFPTDHNRIRQVNSLNESISGVDVLVILTDWPEFAAIDPLHIRAYMRGNIVFDMRRCLTPATWQGAGYEFHQLGSSIETSSTI